MAFAVTLRNFTLEELGLAYRKAKVDLYYSSNASLLAIADYEDKLVENLHALLLKLNGDDDAWIEEAAFLGDWTLAPKSIQLPESAIAPDGVIFSSPADEWQHRCEHQLSDDGQKPIAEFRLMAKCSMDFHVLSALWMQKVGCQYDHKLSKSAYGNRLRKGRDDNAITLGSFKPYQKNYGAWIDGSIKAMRSALEEEKKVVSLTADVRNFYHELNPSFMLDADFRQLLDLNLSAEDEKLNYLFIKALQAWAQNTPLKRGLPVGLPASAVVANMALIELDRLIEQQVAPLYYGRYVDDILLVMENGTGFKSKEELFNWLIVRSHDDHPSSHNKLDWAAVKKLTESKELRYQPLYLSGCEIRFANDKNKLFLLEGKTGQALVDVIAEQIHERASEWRALPVLPASIREVANDLIAATRDDGEKAGSLFKTSAVSLSRSGFAIMLRNFEAFERDLLPADWQEQRHAFLNTFCLQILVLPKFFDLEKYLSRVVQLATACEDFKHLQQIIIGLQRLYETVEQSCVLKIKAFEGNVAELEYVGRWKNRLLVLVRESILAAFPLRMKQSGKQAWQKQMGAAWQTLWPAGGFEPHFVETAADIEAKHVWLFSYDLAHQPFRFIGLPKELVGIRGIPNRKSLLALKAADFWGASVGLKKLADWIRFGKGLPHGLLFATRPLDLPELYLLAPNPFTKAGQADFDAVVKAVIGCSLKEKTPCIDSQGVLQIPDGKAQPKQIIAVSSWKTEYDSWVASVMRKPEPDSSRYVRLNRLVNTVIALPQKPRYFILPEMAMPYHWFMRIARKLQGQGISLITGMEYLHTSKTAVQHQVWAALTHDGLGYPAMMIYRQDKLRPALHEGEDLQNLANLTLVPQKKWKKPPIIQHGDFRFALLVCSELTNISYRTALRGQIDALFVPEWNQDIETFNALVESAALDIHAYIIQCNDRQYGDSRIRAPYKDSWKRDVLRVKGGIHDYCVTGEIDVQALRQFQSSHRSPSGPFKPVPDGFAPAHARKTLPKGGES